MRDLITTATEELRTGMRSRRRRQRLAVCAAFRPGDRADLVAITKLALGLSTTELIRCLKRCRRDTFDLLPRELLV